jgi:hypothetical protein
LLVAPDYAPPWKMASSGLKTACISKVFPTRSHTVAARGVVIRDPANLGLATSLVLSSEMLFYFIASWMQQGDRSYSRCDASDRRTNI